MKKILIFLGILLAVFSLSSTVLGYNAYAQSCPSGEFCNPLCPDPNATSCADTVAKVIAKIMGSLYIFAIPISSIFILWGAFQILMSAGEAEKINKGKKTILYAIIGLLLMIFASGIGYVITDILGAGSSVPVSTLSSGDYCYGTGAYACSNCPSGYHAGTFSSSNICN